MTREQACQVWEQHNSSDALRKHAYAVEGVMRYFAAKYGEDEEFWGQVGLLHDVDYEKYPDQHCVKAQELLADAGYKMPFIHAVCSHGWGICCEVEPQYFMEKVLYTVDELTGLINATVLMRPTKSIQGLEVKSVKKKFKDARFAAGVSRDVILKGCDMLDITLEELIAETIAGMQTVAEAIGLAGE